MHDSDSALTVPRGGLEGNSRFVVLIAGTAAIGGFLFGFDTAVINGAVSAFQAAFGASNLLTGLAVSSALLGSAVGAFFAGQVADRIGRTRTMIIASGLFFLSALGSGLAFGVSDFIAWRVLGGIAVGGASVITPAYIAEVSPAALRGRFGSFQQFAIVIGIFLALLTDYGIATAAGSASNEFWFGLAAWRWMFLAEIPPAILYGCGALRIPESPRHLVSQGQEQQASAILMKVQGGDVATKIADIRRTVATRRQPRLSDLWGGRYGFLPIVWVGFGLAIFQQLVGINVIFYYSSVLWRAVGFTEANSLLITVITSVTNIVTTLIATAYVDKFGRKPLLLLGSIGMTLTLGTLTAIFRAASIVDGELVLSGGAGVTALLAANLFVFCFGFSWGPVMWIMLGEMFNNTLRGVAISAAGMAQWVSNFLVSTTFPVLLGQAGPSSAYSLYTIAAAISFFFVWFFVPETSGVELEDM